MKCSASTAAARALSGWTRPRRISNGLGRGRHCTEFSDRQSHKALCDRLVLSRQLPVLSRTAMRQWLLEDLRLDPELLVQLISLGEIRLCLASGFKRRQLGTLLKVIESLQQDPG